MVSFQAGKMTGYDIQPVRKYVSELSHLQILTHFAILAGMTAHVVCVGMISLHASILIEHHHDALNIAYSWHIEADEIAVLIFQIGLAQLVNREMRRGLAHFPMVLGIVCCKGKNPSLLFRC